VRVGPGVFSRGFGRDDVVGAPDATLAPAISEGVPRALEGSVELARKISAGIRVVIKVDLRLALTVGGLVQLHYITSPRIVYMRFREGTRAYP